MVELTFGDKRRERSASERESSEGSVEPVRVDHNRHRTAHNPAENPASSIDVSLDDELRQIVAAKADPQAFAPIYERYVDLVYAYCLRRLGDPELAADATSTVFARALSALPSFEPQRRVSGSTFRSWLMTIARNVVIDLVRRQPATTPIDLGSDNELILRDRQPTPEEHAIQADERLRIERALTQLPATQRHIVELRGIGMKGAEIADILGMSVGAVKTAHFRAYSRLRILLHEERLP